MIYGEFKLTLLISIRAWFSSSKPNILLKFNFWIWTFFLNTDDEFFYSSDLLCCFIFSLMYLTRVFRSWLPAQNMSILCCTLSAAWSYWFVCSRWLDLFLRSFAWLWAFLEPPEDSELDFDLCGFKTSERRARFVVAFWSTTFSASASIVLTDTLSIWIE